MLACKRTSALSGAAVCSTHLSREREEVVVEMRVRHDLGDFVELLHLVGELEEDLLSPQHVRQLLLHQPDEQEFSSELCRASVAWPQLVVCGWIRPQIKLLLNRLPTRAVLCHAIEAGARGTFCCCEIFAGRSKSVYGSADSRILARREDLVDDVRVAQLQCAAQRLRVLLEPPVDGDGGAQQVRVLRVRDVRNAAATTNHRATIRNQSMTQCWSHQANQTQMGDHSKQPKGEVNLAKTSREKRKPLPFSTRRTPPHTHTHTLTGASVTLRGSSGPVRHEHLAHTHTIHKHTHTHKFPRIQAGTHAYHTW